MDFDKKRASEMQLLPLSYSSLNPETLTAISKPYIYDRAYNFCYRCSNTYLLSE